MALPDALSSGFQRAPLAASVIATTPSANRRGEAARTVHDVLPDLVPASPRMLPCQSEEIHNHCISLSRNRSTTTRRLHKSKRRATMTVVEQDRTDFTMMCDIQHAFRRGLDRLISAAAVGKDSSSLVRDGWQSSSAQFPSFSASRQVRCSL
jgi:hypothetical protein